MFIWTAFTSELLSIQGHLFPSSSLSSTIPCWVWIYNECKFAGAGKVVSPLWCHDYCQDSIFNLHPRCSVSYCDESNSLFLFDPCLPLVWYSFPLEFPSMSPQESCNLVFFPEDDPLAKPYNLFDILIGANTFQLKAVIQQRVKILHNIDADCLKLWKVISLIPRACAFWLSLSGQCDGPYRSRS
jgi:hypothetical protein